MTKKVKVQREAWIKEGKVYLRFRAADRRLLVTAGGRLILQQAQVDALTGGLIRRDETVLEECSLESGWELDISHDALVIPTSQGRDGIKRATTRVLRSLQLVIGLLLEEAKQLRLQGWLWEKAEAIIPEDPGKDPQLKKAL